MLFSRGKEKLLAIQFPSIQRIRSNVDKWLKRNLYSEQVVLNFFKIFFKKIITHLQNSMEYINY